VNQELQGGGKKELKGGNAASRRKKAECRIVLPSRMMTGKKK